MRSPFEIFRKNQKTAMAALVFVALFAFVVLGAMEPMMGGQMPPQLLLLMFGTLGAGVMWFLGAQQGKATEYAICGALLGVLLGILVPRLTAAEPAVRTSVGNLSERELENLRRQRQIANGFLTEAFAAVFPPSSDHPILRQFWEQQLNQHLFRLSTDPTQTLEDDVVLGYVLRHEADRMGIVISDEAVAAHINQATNHQLSKQDFRSIHRRMGLGEKELFDVLREELTAQLVRELKSPRAVASPEQFWQYYQRLNVQQSLDVTAVPISAFLDQVTGEPAAAELNALFERGKHNFPGRQPAGEPAFGQPRQVQLAYLEADFGSIRDQVPAVADEEIEQFYEENKDLLYQERPPEKPRPDDSEQPIDPPLTPETPENGQQPDETAPPEGDARPENGEGAADETATPPAQADEDELDEEPLEEPPGPAEEPAAEQTPPPAEPAEPPVATDAGERPAADAAPEADQPAETDQPAEEEPAPEYRPLDDDLRAEIRERLTEERAAVLLNQKLERAEGRMIDLGEQLHLGGLDDQKRTTPQQVSEQLREFADANTFRYVVTDRLTRQQLVETDAHPIADAVEPFGDPRQRRSVLEIAFEGDPRRYEEDEEEGLPPGLYLPHRAIDPITQNGYVYWKIQDVPPRVPTFEEARDQVVRFWRESEAAKLAAKRAEALAERVKQDDDMAVALENETVTGRPDDQQLTVHETERFSWYRTVTAAPTGFMQVTVPELSTISAIDNAGEEFMQTVFERLNEGDVGVAPNDDRSVYYVVRVKERTPASKDRFLQENLFGTSNMFGSQRSPYEFLAVRDLQGLDAAWLRQVHEEYDVRWMRASR